MKFKVSGRYRCRYWEHAYVKLIHRPVVGLKPVAVIGIQRWLVVQPTPQDPLRFVGERQIPLARHWSYQKPLEWQNRYSPRKRRHIMGT